MAVSAYLYNKSSSAGVGDDTADERKEAAAQADGADELQHSDKSEISTTMIVK